jgi:hypothetical protein
MSLMNIQEYRQLQAERSALEKLIGQLPASSVIERVSLEARKREVEEQIASESAPQREPARLILTFRGKPIVGNHGMFADFGAAVISCFSEAIAAIGAGLSRPLGTRGAIPSKEEYRLLITGTATGSFGFELEEAPKDQMRLIPELSPLEAAIEQVKAIMIASLGTDDELIEAISETDPRALDGIRAFLKVMADREAACTLEFKDEAFRFSDAGQVQRSVQRLSRDNIHEEDIRILGQFQGVLPKRGTFEFVIMETGNIIFGRVGNEIETPSDINKILYKDVQAHLHITRAGTSQPRYTLLGYVEEPSDGVSNV